MAGGLGAASGCVKGDCEGYVWLGRPGEAWGLASVLLESVFEIFGKGLSGLPARDGDACWSGLVGGCGSLPGIADTGESEGLAVEAGRFQQRGRDNGDDDWFAGLAWTP